MVKCRNCGLLSIFDPGSRVYSAMDMPGADPPEYVEATRRQREEATPRFGSFVCHADEPAFREEAGTDRPAWADILDRERHCASFMSHVLGFSPKEHVAMRFQEMLREREDRRDREQRRHQWGQLIVMLLTVAAILVAAWIRPASKVEVGPIEVKLPAPTAADSGASRTPTPPSE